MFGCSFSLSLPVATFGRSLAGRDKRRYRTGPSGMCRFLRSDEPAIVATRILGIEAEMTKMREGLLIKGREREAVLMKALQGGAST